MVHVTGTDSGNGPWLFVIDERRWSKTDRPRHERIQTTGHQKYKNVNGVGRGDIWTKVRPQRLFSYLIRSSSVLKHFEKSAWEAIFLNRRQFQKCFQLNFSPNLCFQVSQFQKWSLLDQSAQKFINCNPTRLPKAMIYTHGLTSTVDVIFQVPRSSLKNTD